MIGYRAPTASYHPIFGGNGRGQECACSRSKCRVGWTTPQLVWHRLQTKNFISLQTLRRPDPASHLFRELPGAFPQELFTAAIEAFGFVFDPKIGQTYEVGIVGVGNPHLQPETGYSYYAGLVGAPGALIRSIAGGDGLMGLPLSGLDPNHQAQCYHHDRSAARGN